MKKIELIIKSTKTNSYNRTQQALLKSYVKRSITLKLSVLIYGS